MAVRTPMGRVAVSVCDNCPELACEAMTDRDGGRVGLAFIPPGEPWRSGYPDLATNASTSTFSVHSPKHVW